ncbi:MAG: GFA family protein [Pseudomonadota bacterium]
MWSGGCECGKVRFEAMEARPTITVCHCSQCRRTSGHLWASTYVAKAALTFLNDEGLTWYASSDFAQRGFCRFCGSSLFYRMNDEDGMGVAAGCLDDAEGLIIAKHIFAADKGGYYEIPGGAPVFEQG